MGSFHPTTPLKGLPMTTAEVFSDMEDFLEFDPMEDFTPPEELLIEASEDASRVLRSLSRLRRQMAEVREVAKAETSRIADWRDRRLRTLEQAAEWYEAALESYARARFRADRTKTLSLPTGTLRLRPAPLVVEEVDPKALAEVAPSLTRQKIETDKAEVKARLKPGPEPLRVLEEDPHGTLAVYPAVTPAESVAGDGSVVPEGTVVPGVEFVVDSRLRFTAKEASDG